MGTATDDFILVDIDVRQSHLDAGIPGQEESCALALAIEERFPGSRPKVLYHNVVCHPKGERAVMHLTAIAVDFVSDFDHGHRLTPCSIPVEIGPRSRAIPGASS